MVTSIGDTTTTSTTSTSTTSTGSIGSSILEDINGGSGINIDELATNLTNAEIQPQKDLVQTNIDETNAAISGYGLVSLQLDTLATSFEQVNDANEIYTTEGTSSNPSAVSFLNVTNDAVEGGYDINVYQLAESQRISSNSYQSTSGYVNGGDAFDLTLAIGTTRTGTYDHAITQDQLNALGDNANAYLKYEDGSGNVLLITQAEIDAAMESLEGTGQYTFANASIDGLILAINNEIASNSGFASSFSAAEVHRTKGISFVQASASNSATLIPAVASSDGQVSNETALGTVSQGLLTSAPVDGVQAKYTFFPGLTAGTKTLQLSDGVTTINVPETDFTQRTDYTAAITDQELQTRFTNDATDTLTFSDGTNSVSIGLDDLTIFGIPVPAGAATLSDLARAINTKADAAGGDFQFRAVADADGIRMVQKSHGTGALASAQWSSDSNNLSISNEVLGPTALKAEAIKASANYNNLLFTVDVTDDGAGLIFNYKSDGAVTSTPTLMVSGSEIFHDSQSQYYTAGVDAVNAPTETVIRIADGKDTLAGIVEAINAADTGVTASLVDVSGIGNDYKIVLSGEDGLDGSFAVSMDSDGAVAEASLGFNSASNLIQAAQDAQIGYEGLLINRGSNVISDVIDGATFQLNGITGEVVSTPYLVLANGSGGGTGFAYGITQLDANTIRFTPKAEYAGQNLGSGPSGGPGGGYTAQTITNPYGSVPPTITVYDVSLTDQNVDDFLDASADPDYMGSIMLYDGLGGAISLPRNGVGGFWPDSSTVEDGETVTQYVAVAQAAAVAAGVGQTTGTTQTNYTGGTINSVKSGEYLYAYTEAQLRADVAASIRNDTGEGHLIFTDDYGNDLVVETSRIQQLSGGGGTSSIAIDNSDFLYINDHGGQNYAGHSHNGDLIDWTMTGDTGAWWIGDGSNNYIDESTLSNGPNVGWIYGSGGALEQTLSTTYQTGKDYQFQVDIGDSSYYNDQGGLNWKVEIFAVSSTGSTLVSSQTGSSNIDAMATKTLSFDANNSALNGQALKIKISKTDATDSSLLVGNIRGTVNDGGAGQETLAALLQAIQEDENYPGNGTAGNDWRFTAGLNGSGLVFSPATSNTSPQLTSGGETAGVAMFRATRTQATSTGIYNNNVNMDGGYQGVDGEFEALMSNPGVPASGNYSNTGTIVSTVGTTGGGTFRMAYSNSQLQMDLLAGRINDEGDSGENKSYLSFSDGQGNTIMIERADIAGSPGNETVAGLVQALQQATAVGSSSPSTTDYASFGYNISADASGLVFTPKTAPNIGDVLSLQMQRSSNNFETNTATDGAEWATQEPLRHTVIEDVGIIPGTGVGGGYTYLTKYRTETIYDSARLTVTQDKSQLKTNLEGIVQAYNDLEDLIDELNTPEAVEAGLSLAGEGSLLRSVQSRIYNALISSSSTQSGSVDALRDLGISVNRTGRLEFDEQVYDQVIATQWDDVVTMLTADTTGQSLYGESPKGLAQDVATIINTLNASRENGDIEDGIIANRTEALSKTEERYQKELEKLDARMEVLYQRYLMQFSAMESLLASLNGTRDYMKGQLDVLSSAYDRD